MTELDRAADLPTLLLSERFDHHGTATAVSAGIAAMKYITGPLPRKRLAIRLRRKLLRLLTHSAMGLNPETAVGFPARKYISARVSLVRIARQGH